MNRNLPIGEIIDIVACDIGVRPAEAPTYEAIAPYVLGVERSSTALRIGFTAEAVVEVEAFAAAERTCCSTLGFEVARDPLVLTITATPAQLDAMQQLFPRP